MATILHVDGSGLKKIPRDIPWDSLTFYVRADGDDGNDGLTEATALSSIDTALWKAPFDAAFTTTTINVGAGTFDFFNMSGFSSGYWGLVKIIGAMKTATLATGTPTGTSTGGTYTTMTDSGQVWTTNNLRGKYLYGDPYGPYLIAENTSTQITIAGYAPFSMSGGTAYTIKDHSTLISGGIYNDKCEVTNCPANLTIEDVRFTSSGLDINLVSGLLALNRLYVDSGSTGIIVRNCPRVSIKECYSQRGNQPAFLLQNSTVENMLGAMSYGTVGAAGGVQIENTRFVRGTPVSVSAVLTGWVDGAGTNGFSFYDSEVFTKYITAKNCGNSGVYVERSVLDTSNTGWALSGSGNGTFGLSVGRHSTVKVKTFSITGTVGDYSTDGDPTSSHAIARTWATDFPNVGDKLVVSDTHSIVERS